MVQSNSLVRFVDVILLCVTWIGCIISRMENVHVMTIFNKKIFFLMLSSFVVVLINEKFTLTMRITYKAIEEEEGWLESISNENENVLFQFWKHVEYTKVRFVKLSYK